MRQRRASYPSGKRGSFPPRTTLAFIILMASLSSACAMDGLSVESGDLLVRVEAGSEWMHQFSLFQKNPPQVALWLETEDGRFAGTIFVTRKVATDSWLFSGGDTREEALPVWKHLSENDDYDAVTSSSPKASFELSLSPRDGADRRFVLFAEVNHSTDFNDAYPKDAQEGDAGYSGGKYGSGQPSLVYRCPIDLDSATTHYTVSLVGHGSADGSDGDIREDLSGVTDALNIVSRITVEVR